MNVLKVSEFPATRPADSHAGWVSVATHSHMLRSGKSDFEAAKTNLLNWAERQGIGAVGVGSPWEPVSAARYRHYEQVERDLYFSGGVNPAEVMDRRPIGQLICELNRRAAGKTLFFLDNETPKNRHGHLWYLGFDYQVPAWHDYSQDHRVQFWDGDPCEDPNHLTGGCHRRRSYLEVVARQRVAGALAIWAHPTSWWRHAGAFITNIAAELPLHLHADGTLDGVVVQGYDAFHRAYQALWFALLDLGATVPGFAELDACFDEAVIAAKGCFLNYIPNQPAQPCTISLVAEARLGHQFVSSGPHLELHVDGQPMGSKLTVAEGQRLRVSLDAWPAPGENSLARVELLGRGGAVLAFAENFSGGRVEFEVVCDREGGYLVGRAFGENDFPFDKPQQRVRHCALTNPVYLRTPHSPHFVAATTDLNLQVAYDSKVCGATCRLCRANGVVFETLKLSTGNTRLQVPADCHLKIDLPDGTLREIPLAMANQRLREHINYLSDGEFLNDYPELTPGEVPVAAFRLDQTREALQEQRLQL